MSEGLRAEDVKEALEFVESAPGGVVGIYQANMTVRAAARAWLASQEQTPDYEAAAKAIDAEVKKWPSPPPSGLIEPGWWGATTLELARAAVDAALVGFHPQPEGDER